MTRLSHNQIRQALTSWPVVGSTSYTVLQILQFLPIISRHPVAGHVASSLEVKPSTTHSTAIGDKDGHLNLAVARPAFNVESQPISALPMEQIPQGEEAKTLGIPPDFASLNILPGKDPKAPVNASGEVPVLTTSPVDYVVISDGDARADDYDSEVEVSETEYVNGHDVSIH